jgi:ABC-type transporter Mla subunit MlaD
MIDEAGRIERASQVRVEQLLQLARESEGRTESLMRMPRELIDEANARSAALAEMSRTVSSVVSQLCAAGDAARAQSRDIRETSTLADDRLELLKQHTARVGQLVGIIRQLYGAVDARIEGLRDRLDQADELCRSVPDEINSLRSALTEKRIKRAAAAITAPAANSDSGMRRAGGKVVAQISKGSESATGHGTLGDIVSRNRKLHEWLRDTLREAGSEDAVGRTDGVDETPQPNRSALHEAENVSA